MPGVRDDVADITPQRPVRQTSHIAQPSHRLAGAIDHGHRHLGLLDGKLLVGDLTPEQAARHRDPDPTIGTADRLQESRLAGAVVAHLVEALRLALAELLLGGQQQVEIGLEAAEHGHRPATDRRRADHHQAADGRVAGHELDADMAAQRPAHHQRLFDTLVFEHFGDGAGQPVDAIIGHRRRIARCTMPRQIQRDQPVALGERAVELLAEHLARGTRPVQQQQRLAPAVAFAEADGGRPGLHSAVVDRHLRPSCKQDGTLPDTHYAPVNQHGEATPKRKPCILSKMQGVVA
ncbi:MAG: hypothetical protein ABS47_07940 [Devosia sp. SCN 66-27]|nr:MAG: hypothetical protein ABS47_07940 [Devosia sp. SCN 66-27]